MHQFVHDAGVEQHGGVLNTRTGGHDMQVRLPVTLYHVLDADLLAQHMSKTDATFETKTLGHGRMAQIRVDEQHGCAVLRERGRKIA